MMLRPPRFLLEDAVRAHKAGRLSEAQSIYRGVLKAQPRNSAALRLYGFSLHQQGEIDAAITQFRRAIQAQRGNAEAWRNLGLALRDKGDLDEALKAYESAISWKRDFPEAFRNLGNVLADLKRKDEAIAALREALRLKPDYAEAFTNLGALLSDQEKHDEAIEAHRRAIALMPKLVSAHNNLGSSLLRKGEYETAARVLQRAIGMQGTYAVARSNLGVAWAALGRKDDAGKAFEQAVSLAPDDVECLRNLGIFHQQHGNFDEAVSVHARIAKLRPKAVDPHFNIANLYAAQGRLDEAAEAFRGAIAAQPEDSNAHLALGFFLLSQGDYVEGFAEYEWRRRSPNHHNRTYEQPEWQGEDIRGRRIFLHHEQGLGDALQFARFAHVLHERGSEVRLEVHKPLRAIIAQAFPMLSVFAAPEEPGEFDVHAPLMSVPHRLGLSLADIEGQAYLRASPERMARWSDQLAGDAFNIGIVWQGNPQGAIDRGRSIPLRLFEPLASIPGVRLFSLQKNFGLDQLETLPPGMIVHRLPEDFDSGPDAFLDSAGLMQQLDLVVTSDTSVAHVAGALGRPVWLVLKHAPDWRWGRTGETSSWYQSMRLFRQTKAGDWSSPFTNMARELSRILEHRS